MKKAYKFLLLCSLFSVLIGMSSCSVFSKSSTTSSSLKPNTTSSSSISLSSSSSSSTTNPPKTCTVYFYQDTNLLKTDTFDEGTRLQEPQITLTDNEAYHYDYIGWDADDDEEPETFPYTITEDTTFVLLYKSTQIVYHYDIYVQNQKIVSKDAHYGDEIQYPSASTYWVGQDPHIFIGWEYDGVYDGLTYLYVTKNVRIDAHYTTDQVLKIIYNGYIYAAYVPKDTVLDIQNLFKLTASTGKQIIWYLDEYCSKISTVNKMPEGNLVLYGREENIVHASDPINVSTKEQLLDIFNLMILNHEKENIFNLSFNDSIDVIVNYLVNNSIQIYNYQLTAHINTYQLSITISYDEIATTKNNDVFYTQIKSLNTSDFPKSRLAEYDDFASDKHIKEMKVKTSDALYYAIENNYRPNIDSNAQTVASLYATMKSILREIIDDNMTDIEKAKAIYEYIIMTTTYDGATLEKIKNEETSLAKYNSFYLEGVLIDHLAVCDGISKAYSCLCNMEGIECVRVTGMTNEKVAHAWNKIRINNKWYIVDVTSGGTIVGEKEILSYSYFMLTNEQYSKHATEFVADTTRVCDTEYDIYENITVNSEGNIISLSAKNRTEAANIFKYFVGIADSEEELSFDFRLNYSYDDIGNEITEILTLAQYFESINFAPGLLGLTVII